MLGDTHRDVGRSVSVIKDACVGRNKFCKMTRMHEVMMNLLFAIRLFDSVEAFQKFVGGAPL